METDEINNCEMAETEGLVSTRSNHDYEDKTVFWVAIYKELI